MDKQIFIINGSGGVGKDEFVECVRKNVSVRNISSVDRIKDIAECLGWKNDKSEIGRKFLSDLKLLASEYNEFPFSDMLRRIERFISDDSIEILFIHVREPKEINKLKAVYPDLKTIVVINENVKKIESNMADANVENYTYDFVINNSGTIEDLQKLADEFVSQIKL